MKTKIIQAIFLAAAVFAMGSCLKDNIGENWTSSLKGKMYAEIPDYGVQVFVIQPVAADQIFKFLVNIATDALPSSDIKVSLGVDLAALEAYNQELHTDTSIHYSYQFFPGAVILDPELTIKAGTRNTYCHIKLPRADTLNLNNKYLVPVTITSVTTGVVIAENKKTVLYTLPLANKWEGTYKMKGYVLREGDPVLTGYYSGRTVKLATNGPNSVIMTTLLQWADDGGTIGGIGNWIITINESATPNPITVSDPTNPAVKNLPTYPNRYDPSSRTFYMSVYWGTGPTNRATVDTLVYSGPLK